jgi:DNA polymerase III sliding clamp (beta) subunit (PCNA family)
MLVPSQVFEVRRFASTDPSRYQLIGVHFSRRPDGSPCAVATSGKILAETTWTEDPGEEYPSFDGAKIEKDPSFSATISTTDCAAAQKAACPKAPKPILNNVLLEETTANGNVQILGTDLDRWTNLKARTVEGTFPNYENALPSEDAVRSGVTVRLSLDLLKTTIEALMKIHGKDADADFTVMEPSRPVLIVPTEEKSGIKTKAMIMPLVIYK